MKTHLFLIMIFASNVSWAQCEDSLQINANNFLGYGKESDKIKKIATIKDLPSHVDINGVANGKGVYVGKYLFVNRNNKWEVFRRDEGNTYREFKTEQNSILVTTDEKIFVKRQENGQLTIRRNNADEAYQSELALKVIDGQIQIKPIDQPVAAVVNYVSDPSKVSAKESIDVNMKKPNQKVEISCLKANSNLENANSNRLNKVPQRSSSNDGQQ